MERRALATHDRSFWYLDKIHTYSIVVKCMSKSKKPFKLRADEIYPYEHFKGKKFVKLPYSITQCEELSMGAKVLYGILMLHAPCGAAYPKQETIQNLLGGVSTRTIRRWLRELEEEGLIRTKQKWRGLPNNYYFLHSPILDDEKDTNRPAAKASTEVQLSNNEITTATQPVQTQEEVPRPPMPVVKDYATMDEFVAAIDKWEREVHSAEYIKRRDEIIEEIALEQ